MDGAWLVAGLGNPGPKYANTRHNMGFLVLDELCARSGGGGWREKFLGEVDRVSIDGNTTLLLKPQTFMNLSGRSVARAATFHRIEPERIIVVHDELDLDFGAVRVKVGGGTGGHKGIASCKADMGTADFLRVRLGIGHPRFGNATNFVLESFNEDEQAVLTEVIARGAQAVYRIIADGAVKAMNEFNKRQGDDQ